MRKIGYLAAAAAAALAAAAGPAVAAQASSTASPAAVALPVLTLNTPAGAPAVPGQTLAASLTSGSSLRLSVAPGSPIGLTCTQSTWQGQLMANPAVPGPAVIQLMTPFTISSCMDSNPTVTGVTGVAVSNLPAILQVNGATPFPIQILPSSAPLLITVTVTTTTGSAPTVCKYQAAGAVNGSTAAALTPWVFTNQPFNPAGPTSPACGPGVAFFSAAYSPVTDLSAGGANIYVN